LAHIRARGRTHGCRWSCRSFMQALPASLLILALLVFYSPIMHWGCIPHMDGTYCSVRQPVNGGRARQWVKLAEYERWFDNESTALQRWFLAYAILPVAILLLLSAAVTWAVLRKCSTYDGRLLVVPCHTNDGSGGLRSRLWCLHEIATARAMAVPAVLSDSLAPLGVGSSKDAVCTKPLDAERIQEEIEASGPAGYRRVDQAVSALPGTRRQSWALMLLAWTLCLVILRSADRRLTTAPTGWEGGRSVLNVYYGSVLAISVAVVFSAALMSCVALFTQGRPHACSVLACAMVLIAVAVGVTAVLMYNNDLEREMPSDWAWGFDLLSSDCYGYLLPAASGDYGCKIEETAYGSLAQTLLIGGVALLFFLLGALVCRVPGVLQSFLFAVALAVATLVTTVHDEPKLPDSEFVYPFIVYYLTTLWARSLAPILAIWAFVSRWDIRPRGCGQCRLRRAPKDPDSGLP